MFPPETHVLLVPTITLQFVVLIRKLIEIDVGQDVKMWLWIIEGCVKRIIVSNAVLVIVLFVGMMGRLIRIDVLRDAMGEE